MEQKKLESDTWLDLSDAAEFLGVHFTTLRRWANSGAVPHMRTPGGRRRFSVRELQTFILNQSHNTNNSLALNSPLQDSAINHARQSVQALYQSSGEWMSRLDEQQRAWLKGTGRRLTALLLQYNSRTEGDEAFLEEGRRIVREYSRICSSAGFPLPETVRVFLVFHRSILDAVYETRTLSGSDDPEGHRLYHRTNNFMDELLLSLVESYPGVNPNILE